MIIGIPKERKQGEGRVVLTPQNISELAAKDVKVLLETGAGLASGFEDLEYSAVGVEIVSSLSEVWQRAELLVKVKEPAPEELQFLRKDLCVFSFLHPAANPELVSHLTTSGCTSVDFDLVSEKSGEFPILAPMSAIAGSLSIFCGFSALQPSNGGRGVLLGGIAGVEPAHVLIVGAGVAGSAAAEVAFSNGADVCVLDINPLALAPFENRSPRLRPLLSDSDVLREEIKAADLIIGAVLVPGDRAPRLITNAMLSGCKKGAALVDICIDQGGMSESSRATSISSPVYVEHGVVHYCVPNMPALVPRTATIALSRQVAPWVNTFAELGISAALKASPALEKALVTTDGAIVNAVVKSALEKSERPA
jgi:alanine dehydrogenase